MNNTEYLQDCSKIEVNSDLRMKNTSTVIKHEIMLFTLHCSTEVICDL